MDNVFEDVVILLLGCCLILFRKQFGQLVVRRQNNTWGFHFGDIEAELSEAVAVLVGVAALGFGVLRLFG